MFEHVIMLHLFFMTNMTINQLAFLYENHQQNNELLTLWITWNHYNSDIEGKDKMATIMQTTFVIHFHQWKSKYIFVNEVKTYFSVIALNLPVW